MRSIIRATTVSAVLLLSAVALAAKIDHVVVLMMENHSFDNMCGWLTRNNSKINGLTGKEFNMHQGKKYTVADTCPYVNPFDPDHEFNFVQWQLFGKPDEVPMGPAGGKKDADKWIFNEVEPAPMSGFASEAAHRNSEFWNVMTGYPPERVPAISTLAMEFAIFDKWHASLPGPTQPNRQFVHSGTSNGITMGGQAKFLYEGYPQKLLIDVLNEQKLSWEAYYQDISDLLYFERARLPENLARIRPWEEFISKAAEGALPSYTWLSPQFYPGHGKNAQAKDQHPDHDVAMGDQVIAEAYAALRNGPKWNNTLFLVTYDEHGGFYDHVPPPTGVPNPDGKVDPGTHFSNNYIPFNFTREGIRVCTVAASPWIPKKTIANIPASSNASCYEHGSVFSTLKDIFPAQLKGTELTNRTNWAPSFAHLLSLDEPRTDAPTQLPIPSVLGDEERMTRMLAEEHKLPVNGLQKELYRLIEALHQRDGSDVDRFKSQIEISDHVNLMQAKYLESKLGRRG